MQSCQPNKNRTTTSLQIRLATLADAPAIRAVGVAAWYDTYPGMVPAAYIPWALEKWWTPAAIERHITSPQFIVLVAELEGQIVGIAHVQTRPDQTAILWRLYVNHTQRGQGIGTWLLKTIESRLPPEVHTLYIEYYQQNYRAGAFYAAHGFVFDRLETTTFQGVEIVSVFVRRSVVRQTCNVSV